MANPNNAVGTNGAFGGRTSVNALNDVLGAFTGRGILSGWNCSPKSGLTVQLGGNGSVRDVAIAEDATGNKTTVNNISQAPVSVTLNNAPASNSRIDLVVAYIEDSPNGSGETDNPDVVNVLVVSGSAASTPVAPNDSAIRTAITADGASGATAYYVVLAQIRLAAGTTDIDSTMITQGAPVVFGGIGLSQGIVDSDAIADGAVTSDKVDFATLYDVLYDNAQGSSGTIPLSASAANYVRLKIYTIDTDGNCGFVEVSGPDGKSFDKTNFTPYSGAVYIKTKRWGISGTSIAPIAYASCTITSNSTAVDLTQNQVSIFRVEGWKF